MSRYLWSPAIHRSLNQQCCFFLFQASDSRGTRLLKELAPLHRAIGIRGATAYVVQGHDDLIVRVWLTPSRRQAYLDRLEQSFESLGLRGLLEFRGSHVDYGWLSAEQVQTQKTLTAQQYVLAPEVLGLLGEFIDPESLRPHPEAIQSLLDRGFLIAVDDVTPRRIFMFISAAEPDGEVQDTRAHDQIMAEAKRLGLVKLSLYRGRSDGFADYVLKGLIPEPLDVFNVIDAMQMFLASERLRGWTLSPIHMEYLGDAESIDGILQEDASIFAEMLEHPPAPDRARFKELQALLEVNDNLVVVKECVAELEARSGSVDLRTIDRVRGRILGILSGLLTSSRYRVNQELSFLVSISVDQEDVVNHARILDISFPAEDEPDSLGHLVSMVASQFSEGPASVRISHPLLEEYAKTAHRLREEFVSGTLLAAAYGSPLPADLNAQLRPIADAAAYQMFLESLRDEILWKIDNINEPRG